MPTSQDEEFRTSEIALEALIRRLQLDTPWKLANEGRRLALLPVVRLVFWISGVRWGKGWKIYGLPIVQKHRLGVLAIGDRLQLRSTNRSNPLGPNHPVILSVRSPEASLIIGDDFGMTGGSIVAQKHVWIGNRVAVGANTVICDTDFHPLSPQRRQHEPDAGATAPIVIEDDVFIGMQCLVLKGVTIGQGSAIGAGSLVTRDIPAGVVAAGNPARVIRTLDVSGHPTGGDGQSRGLAAIREQPKEAETPMDQAPGLHQR
jgi:acetyltransferase-like isoleucine patch superfamily enzyme